MECLKSHLAGGFKVDSATFYLDPCRDASWLSNEPTLMEIGALVVENEPCKVISRGTMRRVPYCS